MHIYCVGLNHNTAPLQLREQLAFNEKQARAALARLGCGPGSEMLSELIILSTCNRTELYTASSQPAEESLEAFLEETSGVPRAVFHSHLYHYHHLEAAHHLFEVTAGLDSLVIGEPQILGQVTRALELARGQGTVGATLNRLFLAAIHAGKRARTETAISRNPASVSSLAAALAEKVIGDLRRAHVVILGAGEMAELTVEALRKRGTGQIRVINRTLERARILAERWNAEASTFESLPQALNEADILIASTGAPHTLISAAMIRSLGRARPLVLIDIAVPRDIDPACAELPGVTLYDIDSLNAQLEHSLAERLAEAPRVRSILEEELARFAEYLRSLDLLPLIADLHQQAEQIRRAELEKTLRRLPNLSESERQRIAAMSEALVKKLLDLPTRRLRAEAACPHAPEYATVTRTLFGLNHDGLCAFSNEPCPVPSHSQTAAPLPTAAD
ncbi:MAG: glutamyl-tRNA reductase [Anaerolineae bacterium]